MPTPERTTLHEIVAAGRDILEVSGPDGLTMQAVADRVGVKSPSLYKRVAGRDALLRLVSDATVVDLSERLHGATLHELARQLRDFAHERPHGFRLAFSADFSPELAAVASEPIVTVCRTLVPEEDVLDAARTVTAWASGFISMELAGAFRLGGDVESAFRYGVDALVAGLTRPPT